ncbi:MAG: hypothetical protein ACLPSW_03695 [Roseiarcus sp.]
MRLFQKSWLALFALLVGAAAPTWAAGYTCRVPRALLCDGCAQQIAISLQPGGGCRISFTPPPAAPSSNEPAPPGQLELQIQPAPITAAPRAPVYRPRRVVQAPRAPAHPCFTFNGAQYCE